MYPQGYMYHRLGAPGIGHVNLTNTIQNPKVHLISILKVLERFWMKFHHGR